MAICGLILAGGKAQRFGGEDKAMALIDGKPMLHWVIESMQAQVQQLLLNPRTDATWVTELAYPCVYDQDSSQPGPLSGIIAAAEWLEHAKEQYDFLCISPCDTPFLSGSWVFDLQRAIIDHDIAIAQTTERIHHAHCLIRTSALASLTDYFANGGRSLYGWQQQLAVQYYQFDDSDSFKNINRVDDITD